MKRDKRSFFLRNTLRFSLNDCFLSSYLTHVRVFQAWASGVFLYSLTWNQVEKWESCELSPRWPQGGVQGPCPLNTSGDSNQQQHAWSFAFGLSCRSSLSSTCCLLPTRETSPLSGGDCTHISPFKDKTSPVWALSNICHLVRLSDIEHLSGHSFHSVGFFFLLWLLKL